MFWEIIIGAVAMTLITVLFTGPGMWSSSWGWGKNNKEGTKPPPSDPGK